MKPWMPYSILYWNTRHCIPDKPIIKLKKAKKRIRVTERIKKNRDQIQNANTDLGGEVHNKGKQQSIHNKRRRKLAYSSMAASGGNCESSSGLAGGNVLSALSGLTVQPEANARSEEGRDSTAEKELSQ